MVQGEGDAGEGRGELPGLRRKERVDGGELRKNRGNGEREKRKCFFCFVLLFERKRERE